MKKVRSSNCGKCWRSGLTLIEVVVGSAIAGTLLVGLLLSTSAHARQLQATRHKRAAIAYLDEFLVSWAQSRYSYQGLMRTARENKLTLSGSMDGEALFSDPRDFVGDSKAEYQIQVVPRAPDGALAEWKIELVSIEVYSHKEDVTTASKPIASVEILRSQE